MLNVDCVEDLRRDNLRVLLYVRKKSRMNQKLSSLLLNKVYNGPAPLYTTSTSRKRHFLSVFLTSFQPLSSPRS